MDGVAVAVFEIVDAPEVFGEHGCYSICDQGLKASLQHCHRMIINQFNKRHQPQNNRILQPVLVLYHWAAGYKLFYIFFIRRILWNFN